MKYKSIGEMFFAKRLEIPDNIAFKYKENGEWKSVTFKEATNKAEKLAAGLAASGVKKGDKVAIISSNSNARVRCHMHKSIMSIHVVI